MQTHFTCGFHNAFWCKIDVVPTGCSESGQDPASHPSKGFVLQVVRSVVVRLHYTLWCCGVDELNQGCYQQTLAYFHSSTRLAGGVNLYKKGSRRQMPACRKSFGSWIASWYTYALSLSSNTMKKGETCGCAHNSGSGGISPDHLFVTKKIQKNLGRQKLDQNLADGEFKNLRNSQKRY